MVEQLIDLWYKVYTSINDDFGIFLYLSGTVGLLTVLLTKIVEAWRAFLRAATNASSGHSYDCSHCDCGCEEDEDDEEGDEVEVDEEDDSEEFNFEEFDEFTRSLEERNARIIDKDDIALNKARYKELLDKERELVSVWNEIGDALKDTRGWPKKDMPFVQKCVFAIADLKEKQEQPGTTFLDK